MPEIADAIDDAFAELTTAADPYPPQDEPTPDAVAEPSSVADRARDEKGRFAPKDDGAAPETVAPTTETPDQGNVAPAEPAPVVQAIEPPHTWSTAERQHWGKLPAEAQQTVLRREADVQRYMQQTAERLNPLMQAIEPVRQQLQLSGVSEAQYVSQLVAAAQLLETKPYEAIAWLAQQKGVDLRRFAQEGDDEPQNPQIAALQQQIQQLTSYITTQQQTSQQSQQAAIASDLQKFAADPAHNYFDRVRTTMGQLVRAGADGDLKDLYERAIWADPQIRAELIAKQTADAKRQQDEAAAAQRLKAATSMPRVRGEAGNGTIARAVVGSSGISDAVDAAFDQLGA